MAGLGDKTPVSCLQEYLVSKKMVPKYELIFNGVGTHMPKFVFRVQVGTIWEEGTGRSKQEAKHRAAEKMLKSLKVIDDEDKSEEKDTSEFSQYAIENYVGQLKDFCSIQRYPEPKYYLEEAAGPSHSRVFKMVCCVSQLSDFGISRTKKQAKHQAALRMLHRLKIVGSKREESLFKLEILNRIPSFSVTDEEIFEKYNALKFTSTGIQKDCAAYYKDHYMAYLGLRETSPTLKKLISKNNINNFENPLSFIQIIAKELDVIIHKSEIAGGKKDVCYIIMLMTVFPPIAAIGINEENAASNLLKTLLIFGKDEL